MNPPIGIIAVGHSGKLRSPSAEECSLAKQRHRGAVNLKNFPKQEGHGWAGGAGVEYADHILVAVAEAMSNRHPSAESLRQFEEIRHNFANVYAEIGNLKRQLSDVQSELRMFRDPPMGPRDPYAVWVESEEAKSFTGKAVAFVPGHGAIESADTILELRRKIKGHPLVKKVAVVMVPDAAF